MTDRLVDASGDDHDTEEEIRVLQPHKVGVRTDVCGKDVEAEHESHANAPVPHPVARVRGERS